MSFQVFGCPSCKQPFQVVATQAGQVVQCPACALSIEIPASAFEQQPPPDPVNPDVFACPSCKGKFGITPDMVGQQVGCPHCRSNVLIRPPGSPQPEPQTETDDPPIIVTDPISSIRGKKKKTVKRSHPSVDEEAIKDLFAPGFKNKSKPKTDAPKTDVPTTDVPTTDVPTTDVPTTDVPSPKPSAPVAETPTADTSVAKPIEPVRRSPKQPERPGKAKPPGSPRQKPSAPRTDDAAPTPSREGQVERPALPPSRAGKIEVSEPVKRDEPAPEVPTSKADASTIVEPEAVDEFEIAGKDPIDHLLPPRFDVLDPSKLRVSTGKDQFKVLLPDGKGGTTQLDPRVIHVKHGDAQVSLIALSPEAKKRRRLIQNIIAIVIGIIIMAIAFSILR